MADLSEADLSDYADDNAEDVDLLGSINHQKGHDFYRVSPHISDSRESARR